MKILEILRAKGATVHSVKPDATLSDVVKKLVVCNCGSLLVLDEDRLVGIITERDILRACASDETNWGRLLVRDRMSKDLIIGRSEDEVNHVMGLLTENRVRHLPIVDDGQLAGLISIGDVVKAQHDHLSMENHFLKSYITS